MWSPMAKRNIAIASLARPYGDTMVEDLWVEIYAMRDQSGLGRAEFYERAMTPLDWDDQTLESGQLPAPR